MGWAFCGEDNKGRPIGYGVEATCDHPDCEAEIDRGLSYACGDMHGENDPEGSCENYFCGKHLVYTEHDLPVRFCHACAKAIDAGALEDDEDEDGEDES